MAATQHGQQKTVLASGRRGQAWTSVRPLLLPWKGQNKVAALQLEKSASFAALPLTGPGLGALDTSCGCARRGSRGFPVVAVHAQDPAQLVT